MRTNYVCPRCYSEKILPVYAKENIWICEKCGYSGKPIIVPPHLKSFWDKWVKIRYLIK